MNKSKSKSKPTSIRSHRARAALDWYRKCPPEMRAQAKDDWLQVATVAEVRRHWRSYMGALPPWAVTS